MGYSITVWLAVRQRTRPLRFATAGAPPVTVLKPLCGVEHATYECLRSFCEQDHPRFQIVFGVSNPLDPAVAVVRGLQCEFPRWGPKGQTRIITTENIGPAAQHNDISLWQVSCLGYSPHRF
jgi:hypothetical protein